MRLLALTTTLLVSLTTIVSGTALTYRLASSEKSCFFTRTSQAAQKIAFYFAVQSGGSFDIDYSVYGPGDRKIMEGYKERQGDFVFTAKEEGEYRFCFENDGSGGFGSGGGEKMVDFEIVIEDENHSKTLLPSKAGSSPEQHSALEDTIYKVSSQLSTIARMQKYFRTRENRNFSTVRSTEKRILNFSLAEVGMMVGMAGLQVLVVRFFFQGARKGYV